MLAQLLPAEGRPSARWSTWPLACRSSRRGCPDAVTDSSAVVHLADDGPQSAAACREVLEHSRGDRDRRVQPIQERQELDVLAASKVLRP